MASFFKAFFGKCFAGKAMRLSVMAGIMIYVMMMTMMIPGLNAYAEAIQTKDENAIDVADSSEDTVSSNEDINIDDSILDDEKDEEAAEATNISRLSSQREATIICEDIDARTASSKRFLMSDGSYTIEQYSQSVHYIKNGKYENIDNTLTRNDAEDKIIYRNSSNYYISSFEEDKDGVKKTILKWNVYEINWIIENGKENSREQISTLENGKLGSSLNIKEISAGIDVKYSLNGSRFKEDIIINSIQDNYIINYSIKVTGINLVLEDNGDIIALDKKDNSCVMTIPKAFMYDANYIYSEEVNYELKAIEEDSYVLTVIPNHKWINEAGRAFPVTIDPVVNFNDTTTIYSANEGVSRNTPTRSLVGSTLTYIKFNLPNMPTGSTIVSSELNIPFVSNNGEGNYIGAHLATGYWDESQFYGAFNWGTIMVPIASASYNSSTTVALMDLTHIFKSWYNGTWENYGLVLRNGNNMGSLQIASEFNTQSPLVLKVNYRTNIGIEDYWSYDAINAGRAGNAYINKYNDQLTFIHNDISLSGELPITLNHIYNDAWINSNYNINNLYSNMYIGLGWKLNYQQAIVPVSQYTSMNLDVRYKYVYIDADGTPHFFWQENDNSPIIDEDGLGYTLTVDSSSTNTRYTITDANKNRIKFYNTGRLYKLEDSNGNYNEVIYDASFRIVKIRDNANRTIKLEYLSNNYLINMYYDETSVNSDTYNRVINMRYVGTSVYRFTYPDGKKSFFMYENTYTGKLKDIYNFDGYTINLSSDFRTIGTYTAIADTVSARIIEEKISSFSGTDGPFESTVTTISVGQKKELLFYHGKTETISSKAGSTFQTYYSYSSNATNYLKYRNDNLISTEVYDIYGRVINSYMYLNNELISTYYAYDGASTPEATSTDVTEINEEGETVTTGDTEITDNNGVNYDNAGALDTNKITQSSYFSAETKNYLKNASFENNLENWTTTTSSSTPKCRIITHSYQKLYGDDSLVIMIPQVAPITVSVSQITSSLAAGTYTLSGYIKIGDNIHRYGTGSFGAFLQVSNGSTSYITEKITSETIDVNDGFRLVNVTFTLSSAATVTVKAVFENCAGFAWYDGLQLIKGSAPSYCSYNMLENGGFECVDSETGEPETWKNYPDSSFDLSSGASNMENINGSYVITQSDYFLMNYYSVYQDVELNSSVSKNYVLSAWSFNLFVNTGLDTSLYGIAVEFLDSENEDNVIYMPFNSYVLYWQQAVLPFSIVSSTKVRIHLLFAYCMGEVYFDNVSLISSDTASYKYNKYGLLESSTENDGNSYSTAVSTDGSIISKTLNSTLVSTTTRDNNFNVTSFVNHLANVENGYTYDTAGRLIESVIKNTGTLTAQIVTSTNYSTLTSDFVQTITNTDSRGFQTISTFDCLLGVLQRSTLANGQYKTYQYASGTDLLNSITVYNSSNTEIDKIEYTYDSNYRLLSVKYGNTVYSYTYDTWGAVLTVKVNGTTLVTNSYQSANGVLEYKTLGTGYREYYAYDEIGRQISIAITSSTNYKYKWYYNGEGQLMRFTDIDKAVSTLYQYDNLGRLIVAADKTNSAVTSERVDEYKYDAFNRLVSSSAYIKERDEATATSSTSLLTSSALLSTFYYTGGNVKKMTQGILFTDKVNYYYDSHGNLTRENNKWLSISGYSGGQTIIYTRDSDGNLLYKSYYKYTTGTPSTLISQVYAQYSVQTYDYMYKYADYDSTLSEIGLGDSNSYEYTYDELQRVAGKDIKNASDVSIVNEDYTFVSGRNDKTNSTTTFVYTKNVNGTIYILSYDNLGRINQILQSGITNPTKYYYNDQGMLSREDNPYSAQTVMYYYGLNANISSKRIYAYTTAETPTGTYATISYTYPTTSGGWNDRLTSFNGQSIAYNSIGQPTTYRGNTLTWTGLNLMTYGSISYTYNVDGMRMSKTVGGVTTTFYREGNALIRQKNASIDIWFYYDDSGKIIGIKYNGTRYYYLNNAQGDVVGIVDLSGNTVVTYTYDAWGKVISVGGSLAATLGANNPIRYRNYYYDTESGLYYLCSRYYDPETGRFISPDRIIANNLYCYCKNDPVNFTDSTGHSAFWDEIKEFFQNTANVVAVKVQEVGETLYDTASNIISSSIPIICDYGIKVGKTMIAIVENIEMECGVGIGAGVGVDFGIFAVDALWKYDFLNFQGNEHNDWMGEYGYAGIGLTIASIYDDLSISDKSYGNNFASYGNEYVEYNDNNFHLGIGGNFYAILGFTVSIHVDVTNFLKDAKEIWA